VSGDGAYRQVDELLRAAALLAELGFLPATDGNLSVRTGDDRVLITASGVEKRNLDESALVELDLESPEHGRASSEWLMHRALYSQRAELKAVLHVHSPYLTTFAAAHRMPPVALLAESCVELGEIALVPYCKPGSRELGEALLQSSTHASIYLLENHGAVAVGANVREALHRLERAEFLARVAWQCAALGGGVPLNPTQIADLLRSSVVPLTRTPLC
jgi:ribulose-5-phosphate 4-epimerase/fuculose-1-phosphate aldolase